MRSPFCIWPVLLLLLPLSLFAQQELKQLEHQLDTASGIARVQILNELSMHYNHKLRRYQPDSAMAHAQRALALAYELDYKDGEAVAYYRIGNVYAGKEDVHQQMAHYEKWLQVRKIQADPTKIGWALNQLVFLYASSGNETELLRHYEDVKQIQNRYTRPLLAYASALRVAGFYKDQDNLKEWYRYQREGIDFLQESEQESPLCKAYLKGHAQQLAMEIRDFSILQDSTQEAALDYLERKVDYGFRLLEACSFPEIIETSVRLLTIQAAQDSVPSLLAPYAERWMAQATADSDWIEVGKVHRIWALFKQEQADYESAINHFYAAYQNSIAAVDKPFLREEHSKWAVAAVKGITKLLEKEPQSLSKRSHRRISRLLETWAEEVKQAEYAPTSAIGIIPVLVERQKAIIEGL